MSPGKMKKQNAFRSCCVAMALLAAPGTAATEAISDLNLQPISGATSSFTTTPPGAQFTLVYEGEAK